MKIGEKKGIKAIIAVTVFCIIINLMSACGKESKNSEEKGQDLPKIIVGVDNYPPYTYEDTDGKPTGIDMDLATEAFHRMGYQAIFEYINWEDKKALVDEGKIDCIWSSFTMDGRENDYNWAGPYMVSRQVVAVNKSSGIYKLADLEGKKIAVQSTTKPEGILRQHTDARIPDIGEVISLQNRELLYPFMSKGYVEAVAAHETAILQYMKDYDVEYRILEEPLMTVGIGVAFSKNDERGLDKELTDIFQEMRKDGTAEKIIGKYLENPEKYLEVDDNAK